MRPMGVHVQKDHCQLMSKWGCVKILYSSDCDLIGYGDDMLRHDSIYRSIDRLLHRMTVSNVIGSYDMMARHREMIVRLRFVWISRMNYEFKFCNRHLCLSAFVHEYKGSNERVLGTFTT